MAAAFRRLDQDDGIAGDPVWAPFSTENLVTPSSWKPLPPSEETDRKAFEEIDVWRSDVSNSASMSSRRRARKFKMSDAGVTRDELQAELRAIRAETREQFTAILGEVKSSNTAVTGAVNTLRAEITGDVNTLRAELGAKIDVVATRSAGKWTVWSAAGAIIVALIGTLVVLFQVAQTGYDTGREREKENREAIQQEVQRALPKTK